MIRIILMLSILILFMSSACDEDKNPVRSMPIPVEIDNFAIENSDNIYYMLWPPPVPVKLSAPVSPEESMILSIWDMGIEIENAYFPTTSSPCMAVGAVAVAIVEVETTDTNMIDLGFQEDPEEWWIVNCGIEKLWHFSFN